MKTDNQLLHYSIIRDTFSSLKIRTISDTQESVDEAVKS